MSTNGHYVAGSHDNSNYINGTHANLGNFTTGGANGVSNGTTSNGTTVNNVQDPAVESGDRTDDVNYLKAKIRDLETNLEVKEQALKVATRQLQHSERITDNLRNIQDDAYKMRDDFQTKLHTEEEGHARTKDMLAGANKIILDLVNKFTLSQGHGGAAGDMVFHQTYS
jgi:hypothetical protein